MITLPELHHRLAELKTMRRIYEAREERHYVGHLDRMIREAEVEIAALEGPATPKAQ